MSSKPFFLAVDPDKIYSSYYEETQETDRQSETQVLLPL